jgi:hypothetical protein
MRNTYNVTPAKPKDNIGLKDNLQISQVLFIKIKPK